jgi:signal transduction histidine kinase
MCDIAAHEASRLENLTSDFLSYARPRQPETTPSLVYDTVAYVASVCRAHARDKGVTVEIEGPGSLEAEMDPAQVQQALLNLVMNAIDASPPDGIVSLTVGREDDSNVVINVENSGSPITADKLPRLFEPFFTTKPKGTGLGLAIARNIARAHGGDLVISSNSVDKIRFSLILPVARNTAVLASRG